MALIRNKGAGTYATIAPRFFNKQDDLPALDKLFSLWGNRVYKNTTPTPSNNVTKLILRFGSQRQGIGCFCGDWYGSGCLH